jgi:hypothetical protein
MTRKQLPDSSYPTCPEARAAEDLTRMDVLVGSRPRLLSGAYWDPDEQAIILNATMDGAQAATEVVGQYLSEGRPTSVVSQLVELSTGDLDSLHRRVVENQYGWLGDEAQLVAESMVDVRVNAVVVVVRRATSRMYDLADSLWDGNVLLREDPEAGWIEQDTH